LWREGGLRELQLERERRDKWSTKWNLRNGSENCHLVAPGSSSNPGSGISEVSILLSEIEVVAWRREILYF
jgi:hypothetical protein